MLDATRAFKDAPPGNWHSLSIPLSCFTAAGADLAKVAAPFAVETSGHFGLTISEVRLAKAGGSFAKAGAPPPRCPGAI